MALWAVFNPLDQIAKSKDHILDLPLPTRLIDEVSRYMSLKQLAVPQNY